MLSYLPSFRLPVPHLGQDNMVKNNNMPYFMEFQLVRKMWRRSMSHNSSISGMGEPVQAIRVINVKQLLLIMVGINIILSCGKEYVNFVWEFIWKPGWENLVFLQVNKIEMTRKTKIIVHIEVLCILERHW
jgi:hypothetical protein